jgi:hypothetical protein
MDAGSPQSQLDARLRQYQALPEINNAVVSQLDRRELVKIPLEGTPAGEVFLTSQPMLIRRL